LAALAGETLAWVLLAPSGAHVLTSRPDLLPLGQTPALPPAPDAFVPFPPPARGTPIVVGSATAAFGPEASATLAAWRHQPAAGSRFAVIVQPAL
jgi:hypothetical protein